MAFHYSEFDPSPDLADAIACIWFARDRAVDHHRPVERILPDGCMELIVHLGEPFAEWSGRQLTPQPAVFVVGQLSHFLLLKPPARLDTMGIRFRPGGARAFFDADLATLEDRVVPLDELWGPDAVAFRSQLGASDAANARRRTAESFLRRRRNPRRATDPRIGNAVRAVLARRGMMRIETLARELCWTPRQLERRFLIEVGLTPKRLARLVRFQSALSCLPAAPSAATAALDCGFFDQPHMLRDFRSLAGAPPSIVLEQPGALAARLQSDKRLSDYFRAD